MNRRGGGHARGRFSFRGEPRLRYAGPAKMGKSRMFRRLVESARDGMQLGLRFWWAGLVSAFGPRRRLTAYVPGYGKVLIRARESDMRTLRQVLRDREYQIRSATFSERARRRYEAIIAQGRTPVIVDAGANIGAASLWFAAEYPGAHIVAIEPDSDTAALLRSNLRDLGTVLEAALGGSPGHAKALTRGQVWATQTERAESGLPIVTVDEAVARVPRGELFIVKIDIEGFEADLFEGDCGWLDRADVVMIELHDWIIPGSSQSFQAAMGRRSFDLLINGENLLYFRRGSAEASADDARAAEPLEAGLV